jgi:hypothetical protein
MNESVLYTLAQVAVSLDGFSGVVVAFRVQGAHTWPPTELGVLWLLIGDSLLVLLISLLPVPLALANWPPDALWGLGSALLGRWFIAGHLLALRGDRLDRARGQLVSVPGISPILNGVIVLAFVMAVALWRSAFNVVVPRGQAVYVFGLITLVAIAAVEILFFIALLSRRAREL